MTARKTRYEWKNAFNPFLANTGSHQSAAVLPFRLKRSSRARG